MSNSGEIPITVSVPVFGRVALGVGRDSAYEAARRGVFPVVEVGALKRVPLLTALRAVVGDGCDIGPLLARFRTEGKAKKVA